MHCIRIDCKISEQILICHYHKTPMMLFSYVNTKLRDDYSSLDALCDDLDVDKQQLEQKMADAGFEYNPSQNKFW